MKPPKGVTSVAVIGNGLMGQGISQVFARAGIAVRLIGRNPDSLAQAKPVIEANFKAFDVRGMTSADEVAAARSWS